MGADVMRWQYCAQPPDRDLLFGFGPAHEIKRKLLTFWNCAIVLVTYGNIAGYQQRLADLESHRLDDDRPLDRWMIARTHQLVRETTQAYEDTLTVNVIRTFEAFVEDLSNWYIRRSRKRFWADVDDALFTLWYALAQALRVISPVMPFLAEHLWRNLVFDEESIFLAGWPQVDHPDQGLLAEIAEVRRVVELGRQARSTTGLKNRQPLRQLIVAGAPLAVAHAEEIAEELRVKEVVFGDVESSDLRVKPNLPVLGPKLGPLLPEVAAALAEGRFEELDGGRFQVNGHVLEPEDVLVERIAKDGWAVATDGAVTVAIDLRLDDELRLEARLNDLIRDVQVRRKDSGLEIVDRIRLWISDEELLQFADRIAEETLAVSVEHGDELRLEKA
jgi:isoleucyl-tRNA synthetase